MIYLQYAYQKSGLPNPARIAFDVHDTDVVRAEVLAEFAAAFPDCNVAFLPVQVDWSILIYRRSHDNLQSRIHWGRKNMGRVGVGFFCVDDRQFEVVPRASYLIWACREILISTLSGVFRLRFVGKFFLRLVDRILWLKESF
jgi:hypothetical protein